MRPASNDAHKEMIDTKGVRIGYDSSNDIRSFVSLHNKPNKSLKLHPRYKYCLHWPMNELKWNTYE